MKKYLIVFFLLSTGFAKAEIVNKLVVEGNKKISQETIAVYGDIELNKDYSRADTNEILNTLEHTRYQRISNITTKASVYGKTVNTLSGDDVRVSKRLFIPERKLRGFEAGRVGPIANGDYIGGNYVLGGHLSAVLPILPSFENTDFSFFIDAANIWGVDHSSTAKEHNTIRSSVGVGVDFLTPVGPLSFSLSQPISKASSDKTETFRFNLGTSF